MARVLAIGALLCGLTGCGTVQNFQRKSPEDAVVYGGVEIAKERLNHPEQADAGPVAGSLDVALSAVGDTLTLPFTICADVARSINEYYFPPDKEPASPHPPAVP